MPKRYKCWEEKKLFDVYIIRDDVYKKPYIGYTNCTLKQRWYNHKFDSKRTNSKFAKIIREFGSNKFNDRRILVSGVCRVLADYFETDKIIEYDSINNGYNSRGGGRYKFLGQTVSQQYKDNMSKIMNGKNSGETHGAHKLTNKEVLQIRELYKNGMKQVRIAELFNSTSGNIHLIVKNKNWKHII